MSGPWRGLLRWPRSRRSAPALRSPLAGEKSPRSAPAARSTEKQLTTLQQAHSTGLPEVWFDANYRLLSEQPGGSVEKRGADERKVKLGKTLRILQERMPTLLQSPLPQEILSPNITLHLFPSTHPHLPRVSGRVAYIAALWTSPIAWNRVPVIGNVKLEVLTARMVSQSEAPSVTGRPRDTGAVGEQLVVRWRTVGKGKNWGLPFMNGIGRGDDAGNGSKEFTGLFIFDFDSEGRVLSHTIEHVQQDGSWEKGVGATVIGLTDWLLGGIKGGNDAPAPVMARKLDMKGDALAAHRHASRHGS